MIRVGLIGHGGMGGVHRAVYERMAAEGKNVKLVALCDVDNARLGKSGVEINISAAQGSADLSCYALYTDYKEMIDRETLDAVDICLPSFLHCSVSCYALSKGLNVMCEKPMALNGGDCDRMIDARNAAGKKLMIGQCLRFWDEYVFLKKVVDENLFGSLNCAYFFRGGPTPMWSWENWLLNNERSGGCLMDQHIHDVDIIQYILGMPQKVFTMARRFFKDSGADCVSTNYIFDDYVVNAQDDWCINGENAPFGMTFRISFEKGSLVFDQSGFHVCPCEGAGIEKPTTGSDAYYNELVYFYNCIENNLPIEICTPESCAQTIRLAMAELRSYKSGQIEPV